MYIFLKTPQVTRRSNVIVARLNKLLLGVYNHLLRFIFTLRPDFSKIDDNLENRVYFIFECLENYARFMVYGFVHIATFPTDSYKYSSD